VTGGLALRIDPDGRHLTPMAHNFRNSYEVAIDSFGDLWQNDNDDEVRACRTSWMMEGGNMGFFAADGTRTWRADQRPGQSVQTAHWHQDDPGVMPAGDIYGAGGPTGVAVYEGDLLPPAFRGVVLNCDAGRNTVFAHQPVPDGAGFRFGRTIFLTSQRGSTEGYRWDQVSMEDKSAGSAQATSSSAPTARCMWRTGMTRSSAVTRCGARTAMDASFASRPREQSAREDRSQHGDRPDRGAAQPGHQCALCRSREAGRESSWRGRC
jgi:putative membrane-bound dehydrogenase-like protein